MTGSTRVVSPAIGPSSPHAGQNGHSSIALRCSRHGSCRGRETLGIIERGGTLEIHDGRHGTKHTVRLDPQEILVIMAGTESPAAILAYVAAVMEGTCPGSTIRS